MKYCIFFRLKEALSLDLEKENILSYYMRDVIYYLINVSMWP